MTATDEPRREKDRTEIPDPISKKSSTDREEPKFPDP
jgi:hypothetical protein